MTSCIASIDQGTTSTRCMLFGRDGGVLARVQSEHAQHFPRPGWVEHDPQEIWSKTDAVVRGALAEAGLTASDVAGVGITNQRETVVFWNPKTGEPFGNALVWQDTRTDEYCRQLEADPFAKTITKKTGLPISAYFSGTKIRWALENVAGLREAAERGEAVCGTIDCWLIWNLTGEHVTDVTNASRTQLMNLDSLAWDAEILDFFGIPESLLPRITPSVDPEGWGKTQADGPFGGEVTVCGNLGDQHAALMGQCAFDEGEAKNTYGTGCFLLMNTGPKPVRSSNGLLTTLAWQVAGQPACYALEGSVAIAGALIQWLRDNLGLIQSSSEIESLAASVEDNGGAYIVPAFSGLYAPRWRADARGVIAGLTRYVNRAHIARAGLEATAFQSAELIAAMQRDLGSSALTSLRVDGGMTVNELLMQFQADLLEVDVIRPQITETTCLGAGFAAGLASGFFDSFDELRALWQESGRWSPTMDSKRRAELLAGWERAVQKSLGWVE